MSASELSDPCSLICSVLASFVVGGTAVLMPSDAPFDAERFWKVAAGEEVNDLLLTPTFVRRLLENSRDPVGERFCQTRLPRVQALGAPLSLTERLGFEGRYGAPLSYVYGSAETLLLTAQPVGYDAKLTSVGKPLHGADVVARDNEFWPVIAGETGAISAQVSWGSVGYWSPVARRFEPSDPKRWIMTGDVGWRDGEGNIFVTGRKEDNLARGEELVEPERIEKVLLLDPRVRDASVIGVPHRIHGEEIVAVIERKADTAPPSFVAELQARCEKLLSPAECPCRILEIEALPRGADGRVSKVRLRAMLGRILCRQE